VAVPDRAPRGAEARSTRYRPSSLRSGARRSSRWRPRACPWPSSPTTWPRP